MLSRSNAGLLVLTVVILSEYGCGQPAVDSSAKMTTTPSTTSVILPPSTPKAAKAVTTTKPVDTKANSKKITQELDALGNPIYQDNISGPGADAATNLAILDEHQGMEDHIIRIQEQLNRIASDCNCSPREVARNAKEAQKHLLEKDIKENLETILMSVQSNAKKKSKYPVIDVFTNYVDSRINVNYQSQPRSLTETPSSLLFK